MAEKIRTLFIFEILGKPADHIIKSLEKLIEELSKNKGLSILRKDVHEPKKVENKDDKGKIIISDLFSSFAEVEIESDNLNLVQAIVLNMLPSHVEILEPTEFRIKNYDLSSFLTELTVKIHRFDEIAKILMFERNNLISRLKEAEVKIENLEESVKKD